MNLEKVFLEISQLRSHDASTIADYLSKHDKRTISFLIEHREIFRAICFGIDSLVEKSEFISKCNKNRKQTIGEEGKMLTKLFPKQKVSKR